MLVGWLDWQHKTVHVKCEDLTQGDARRAPLRTSPKMNIANLVSHLTSVERGWLEGSFLGDLEVLSAEADGGWDGGEKVLQELLDGYDKQCARSLQILAHHELDQLEAYAPAGLELVTLRWILTHLIEETGRHLGHLDLLRELADGTRGQ